MKNFLLLTAMLWTAFACAEGENLLYNGDFEKKVSIAKALDKNLLQHIRAGWDMGRAPVVILPESWRPCGGAAEFELIDLEEEPERSAFVPSGKCSIHLKFNKKFFNMLNTRHFAPGKYEVSFRYNGKARIAFSDICYGVDPVTGKPGKHLKSNRFFHETVDTQGKWVTHKKVYELGASPGTSYFIFYIGGINGELYLDDIRVNVNLKKVE